MRKIPYNLNQKKPKEKRNINFKFCISFLSEDLKHQVTGCFHVHHDNI